MKKGIICLLTAILVMFGDRDAAAQQFPIGLYSGANNNSSGYLTEIYTLGANMIVCPVDMNSQPGNERSRFQSIIPSNAYSPNDKAFYYSGGYWSTWTPKNPNGLLEGDEAFILRKEFGTITSETLTTGIYEVANTGTVYPQPGVYFLTGPGYKQDYRYSRAKRGYDVTPTNIINYKTVFTMKLGDLTNQGSGYGVDNTLICEISACIDNAAVLIKNVYESDFSVKDADGYSAILLQNQNGISTYNYSTHINEPEIYITSGIGPAGAPNLSSITETYKTVQFKVKWFGHKQLFVKQVDVYDDHIGSDLINNYPTAKLEIENYLNGTNGISHFVDYSNISNWYSLDEPSTLDSYKPYKIVNTIVKGLNVVSAVRKSLITAFSPYYNTGGQYQGYRTFPRWIKDAGPDTLLFDFYPMNKEVYVNGSLSIDNVYQQFNVLRSLLESAGNFVDMPNAPSKFYYTGQAHSYYDASYPTTRVYQPDPYQFNTSAMLALALGAKGLLFYNYLSDGNNKGLNYNDNNSANLRTAFTSLATRLKGSFGNKLLSIKYLKEYLRVYANTYTGDEGPHIYDSKDDFPISLAIPGDGVKRNFIGGIFKDQIESIYRYLFLVNACPESGSKNAIFGLNPNGVSPVYGSNCNYQNFSLTDFENSTTYSISSNNSPSITMNNSEGKLFIMAPVVLNGGRITANETINSAKTLTAPMTIAAGCTLTVSAVYTINSNITVEEGGRIIYTGGGSIVLTNGAQIIQNVMAVDNSNALLNNSQRKIVKTTDGYLHLVYESSGRVWYEISSNNGSTWSVANNSAPLDVNGGKLPAIDCQGNDVVVVWQENYGGALKLKVARFNGGVMNYYNYPLTAFVDINQSYSQNLNPVIAYDYQERAIIAWENKGSSVYPLGITVLHGSLGSFPSSSNWEYDYQSLIPATNSSSVNPTISVVKTPVDQYNMTYHLAWQHDQSSSSAIIKYCKLTANTGGVTISNQYNVSSGSSYPFNKKPSIFAVSDTSSRIVWNGVYDDGADRFSVAVFKATDNNQFWEFGENVNSVNVNGSSARYVVAWAKTDNTIQFTPSNSLNAISTLSDASGFSGKEIQVSNGAQPVDFRALTLNTPASPPNFLKTKQIFTVNKENTLPVSNGRGGCVFTDNYQFYFSIGDISANGQPVKFIELADTVAVTSAATLNKYLVTEPFSINDNTKLSYSVLFGVIDSASALNSLKAGDAVKYRVELIDDKTGSAINTFDNLTFSKEKLTKRGYQTYSISTKGFGNKSARLRLVTESNIKADYAIHNIYSTSPVIKKASAQESEIKKVAVVSEYALEQNYPNPFNPTTVIHYQIPNADRVSLKVYDVLGREITTLVDGYKEAGRYQVTFDCGKLASGVYIYKLESGNFVQSKKMIFTK